MKGPEKPWSKKGKVYCPPVSSAVQGRFGVGACVGCLDQEGRRVAKGLVNYSSSDLEERSKA